MILVFTGLSFRVDLPEQPGRVARVVTNASDVATYCCVRPRTVDSQRVGTCGERSIAEYRIICVLRRADGRIRALGYSVHGSSVMYDDLWTLDEARRAIQQGHRLFTVSPSTGVEVELELHREGIRTSPGASVDHDLDDLPTCG